MGSDGKNDSFGYLWFYLYVVVEVSKDPSARLFGEPRGSKILRSASRDSESNFFNKFYIRKKLECSCRGGNTRSHSEYGS